jgi:hypothetical protein
MRHTCLPTLWTTETSSSGDVTSIETQRFVFLARIMEMSLLASAFSVFDASDSYEVIVVVRMDERFSIRKL